MNDIRWNRIILDDFLFNAILSKDEHDVLMDWAAGETTTYTAMRFHMSVAKVDKLRQQIRKKYDDVQPFTPILPERKKNKPS